MLTHEHLHESDECLSVDDRRDLEDFEFRAQFRRVLDDRSPSAFTPDSSRQDDFVRCVPVLDIGSRYSQKRTVGRCSCTERSEDTDDRLFLGILISTGSQAGNSIRDRTYPTSDIQRVEILFVVGDMRVEDVESGKVVTARVHRSCRSPPKGSVHLYEARRSELLAV